MKNLSSNARRVEARSTAQSFTYPGSASEEAGGSIAGGLLPEDLWPGNSDGSSPKKEQEENQRREQLAREAGFEEARQGLQGTFEVRLASERASLAEAIRHFHETRDEYFQRVETEVVRLAISIARKILHRETQLDPLLLTGVVRVALDKIASNTSVRLRVQPDQIHSWRQSLLQFSDARVQPELVGDASLEAGQVIVETELGTVELSLESQLKEIEQGLFDLLAGRRAGEH